MPTVVDCQSCSRKLRVPDELLGQRVKCPTCGQEFVATAASEAVPPPAVFSAGQPAPLPSSPEPAPPRYEAPAPPRYDAPPRFDAPPGGFDYRAGGYDEFGERRRLRPGAQSAVAGPAIGLLVVGILGALGSGFVLCAGLITVGAGGNRARNMGPGNDAEAFGNLFAFGFYAITLLVSIAVIACSVRMRKLDSYAMAMTGSILACIPCLSPCFVLGIPFGIWALVVINQQDVRDAFQG